MGCDSIATTISSMVKELTTLGPENLKGHRFLTFWLQSSQKVPPSFLGGKRGALLFDFKMSQSDASTFAGEALIQVISESNNEPSVNEPSGTPALFTPTWPARTQWMDLESTPRSCLMCYFICRIPVIICKWFLVVGGTCVETMLEFVKNYLFASLWTR